jgi:hypothetical protein
VQTLAFGDLAPATDQPLIEHALPVEGLRQSDLQRIIVMSSSTCRRRFLSGIRPHNHPADATFLDF